MKEKFDVMGMTCASCQAHVDKSVRKVDGVKDCNVNLLSENMEVEFDETKTNPQEIIAAVQKGGYNAKLQKETTQENTIVSTNKRKDEDLKKRKQDLIASFIFTVPLFYLSMGSMMNWPGIPAIFLGHQNMMIFALTELLLCLPVLFINGHYFKGGFKSLFHLAPNMDSLIAIGSGASVVYSLYAMYMMAFYMGRGQLDLAHNFHMDLYFESAAMIVTLISLGKYFEARSKKRTSDAINSLMELAPDQATVLEDGVEKTVGINDIQIGDLVVVKSGESIAVDGKIVEGSTSVDESMITGESIPVDKTVGDLVIGSTTNQNGRIVVETMKTNAQSTLSQIIALVEEAGNSKAPIARLADVISGYFVPAVIGIAIVTLLAWLVLGESFHFALTMAISVLVISCPCALGLATPTAIMVGTGRAAKMGLLIKNAEALETASKINMMVFDKTGTLTRGTPEVTDTKFKNEEDKAYAISLEAMSSHPLAKAIVNTQDIALKNVTSYEEIAGEGIKGIVDNKHVLAGNKKMMDHFHVVVENDVDYASAGKTPLYFAIDGQYAGVMALQDEIKPGAKELISDLHQRGIKTMMLTGDNERTAKAIAGELNMDYRAEVLPQDKERIVHELQDEGYKVGMIGDGINDAPALTRADVGVSFTSGLDIAIESADLVLMKNDLHDLVVAFDLSKATIKNIKENLFWALFYNAICIPVAAGLFYPSLGWKLSPMLGSFAMSFSSVFVVSNALRLRFFKDAHPHHEAVEDNNQKHEATKLLQKDVVQPTITKTNCDKIVKVEGMMCANCQKHVAEALNAIKYVEAEVNLEAGEAYLQVFNNDVTDTMIQEAVEQAGYKVTNIIVNKKYQEEDYDLVVEVKGMFCKNCENHVRQALNTIDGVYADVALFEGKAYIKCSQEVSREAVKEAIKKAGYEAGEIVEVKSMFHLGKKKNEKTMDIEGMMCEHCVARVSQALNDIDGVDATVSLDKHQADIKLTSDVSDDVLTQAVVDAGYKVKGIH